MHLSHKNTSYFVVLLLTELLLTSCISGNLAPVATRAPDQIKQEISSPKTILETLGKSAEHKQHHIVAKGDTLHSIAWTYNLDYKNIARWNDISKPYIIYPRQIIRLTKPPNEKSSADKTVDPAIREMTERKTKTVKKTFKKTVKKPTKKTVKKIVTIKWQWPTEGKLIKSNSLISRKGVDIVGKEEQPIKAAAPGKVVYAGSSILGYGKLVIIQHDTTYLSAYAHNSVIMVKEGDGVASGQQIAKMGHDSNGEALLHFEIRKNGNPVNPMGYLPKKKI